MAESLAQLLSRLDLNKEGALALVLEAARRSDEAVRESQAARRKAQQGEFLANMRGAGGAAGRQAGQAHRVNASSTRVTAACSGTPGRQPTWYTFLHTIVSASPCGPMSLWHLQKKKESDCKKKRERTPQCLPQRSS